MTQILARQIIEIAIDAGWMICTIESCTGGMVFAALTDIAGSSTVMDRGFVTYSNQAKQEMVGVSGDTLEVFGAVSAQTAIEMAQGGMAHSQADISLAITGIAGPGGGSAEKPVGLVWMAVTSRQGGQQVKRFDFSGDRIAIRQQALSEGLELIHASLPKSRAR